MAAIKFSKQNIKPNPSEVDYWVDITSNPYGGRLKYFNGIDWVDLVNVDDSTVDLNGYYTKLQINQMLSDKASVSSVESKVDDDEIKDVIKNIDIKDIGNDGVQLVLFKYDNTNVAVTFPVASLTTSGIVTAESFKDFVKQHQLQQLYTEMYNKLSEIRTTYQKKLKAGTNIKIDENNTIHAVSDVSLDWEDIYNKPDFNAEFQAVSNQVVSETNRAINAENQLSSRIDDHVSVVEGKLDLKANSKDIYTKDQIDEKISGVYRIKGSRSFNDLPDVNKIGDVYNISNEFTLDGVIYPVGTNIVYTATGWDALSGIFDYTGLEDSVLDIDTKLDEEIIRAKGKELLLDKKFDYYLPLTGGTIGTSDNYKLILNTTDTANYNLIGFHNHGKSTGYIGTRENAFYFQFNDYADMYYNGNTIIHSDNYSKYALPLTGGKVNGLTTFYKSGSAPLIVETNSTNSAIAFRNNTAVDYAYLSYSPDGFIVTDDGWRNAYKIYHEGNFNPSDYLPLRGGTLDTTSSEFSIKRKATQNYITFIGLDKQDGTVQHQGHLGFHGKNNPIFIPAEANVIYKIWHEGNDGEGSGLGADTLDGKHASDFYDLTGGTFIPNGLDLNNIKTIGTYHTTNNTGASTILNSPTHYAFTLQVTLPTGDKLVYIKQILKEWYGGGNTYVRVYTVATDTWGEWILKSTDLSTYNAPTATKLAKPVKLWGSDFDGSNYIENRSVTVWRTPYDFSGTWSRGVECFDKNGSVLATIGFYGNTDTLKNVYIGKNQNNQWVSVLSNGNVGINISEPLSRLHVSAATDDAPTLGNLKGNVVTIGTAIHGLSTWVGLSSGKAFMQTGRSDGNDATYPLCILPFGGNVGIGNTSPQYKLDITTNQSTGGVLRLTNSSATESSIVFRGNDDKEWIIGKSTGNVNNGFGIFSRILGKNAIIFNESGNVGIGTNDPQHKLDVDGYIKCDLLLNHSMKVLSKNNVDTMYVGDLASVDGNQGGSILIYNDTPLCFYNNGKKTMTITGNNMVGIGTAIPLYKLDVNGGIYSNDGIGLANSKYYQLKDTNGTSCGVLNLSDTNQLIFGYGTAARGYDTYLLGNSLLFKVNTTNLTSMVINPSGNVTIGDSDKASNFHKLFVDGSTRTHSMYCVGSAVFDANNNGIYINNSTIRMHGSNNEYITDAVVFTELGDADFKHNLGVSYKITSGDLVDWYGVSWSEDSSDPTCTRIGNMALHRSLPIQSAMKGYMISTASADFPDAILPIEKDWNKASYSLNTNVAQGSIVSIGVYANIMIKIPEFWYVDEYESSTKTHNLKISQTAKAGWCHHKEAYVGAYEGCDQGTYYMSTKGVAPTVSVTREQLRTKARANGYEDEYKWNIYTYEEHRAICHLFLVEYATRNSQAPVNTALTADGFKQGGLGSGCTTGAVKINGVDTYSFIPTGTTDSLGNGSGQVAYTVTLTDADGNEIGTVTRYANRYRGIENPFGHIWKHVDDIVNVYNAETTYKTVYKCNKPEHFATNKNAKYKPLCSFPGGSKMQGWSKEIKATINCDFFKYSVGGSESTYWCDYNYDNDDTSEHCLLIGGHSVHGGLAGLFSFRLDNGVCHSYVNVGSRLTYLPWAE